MVFSQAPADCTPFEFEICKIDPSVATYPATPLNTSAYYAYYSVKLKVKSGSMVSALPSSWTFNYLSFYGKIDLNGFTESIDIPWTQQISSSTTGGSYFQYLDINPNGEVIWRVGSEEDCQESNQPVTLTFPANSTSVELFRIAVKGISGDQILWTQLGGLVCDGETYHCQGCWTYVAGPGVGWHFWQYDNPSALTIQNEETIVVTFPDQSDCVRYYVGMAEAIPDGSTERCALATQINLNEFPACNPEVSGRVFLPDVAETPAPHYYVNLLNGNDAIVGQTFEDCQEEYSFCPDWSEEPFTLEVLTNPYLQNDYCNCGVTTYDLLLISKHVLGIELLPWPYVQLAADVYDGSNDGITTQDITQIQKCILGIEDDFGANGRKPWYHVSINFGMDPDFPAETPGLDEANKVLVPTNGTGTYGYFYAVKMGDVNQSCNCDGSRPSDKRAGNAYSLRAESVSDNSAGSRIRVPVYAGGDHEASALQFGLRFDPSLLKLLDVTPNPALDINSSCFGLRRKAEGEIRFAWFATDGESVLPEDVLLFDLEFEVLGSRMPEGQFLWMSNNVLRSVSYPASGEEIPTSLVWRDAVPKPQLVISPNPAQEQAMLYVHVPSGGEAQLELLDAQGTVVRRSRIGLSAGENVVSLALSDVKPGAYTVRVLNAAGQAAGKLIKK